MSKKPAGPTFNISRFILTVRAPITFKDQQTETVSNALASLDIPEKVENAVANMISELKVPGAELLTVEVDK